ncbi:hypothetical protein Y032_0101g3425 [Ancylostoma ceylanicum]|uniref:Uncharacterized protein n=1 Tax=Ancylostoma ceylanicum TaxID=53326 RepID=A0A016THW0_9BILA|nr:hypothetical protein Y032_0101g3425 [Ancylostoma ceylanicum]
MYFTAASFPSPHRLVLSHSIWPYIHRLASAIAIVIMLNGEGNAPVVTLEDKRGSSAISQVCTVSLNLAGIWRDEGGAGRPPLVTCASLRNSATATPGIVPYQIALFLLCYFIALILD